MDDNLYPTSGAYLPTEPIEQVTERKKEKDAIQHDYTKIVEAISYLDDQIKAHDSVSAIPEEVRLDKFKFAVKTDSRAETVAVLTQIKGWFEDLVSQVEDK